LVVVDLVVLIIPLVVTLQVVKTLRLIRVDLTHLLVLVVVLEELMVFLDSLEEVVEDQDLLPLHPELVVVLYQVIQFPLPVEPHTEISVVVVLLHLVMPTGVVAVVVPVKQVNPVELLLHGLKQVEVMLKGEME
tara:strand:+ start:317 stop:718 length:402 start_codon:yes stop_codon:yes gene_type:complete